MVARWDKGREKDGIIVDFSSSYRCGVGEDVDCAHVDPDLGTSLRSSLNSASSQDGICMQIAVLYGYYYQEIDNTMESLVLLCTKQDIS